MSPNPNSVTRFGTSVSYQQSRFVMMPAFVNVAAVAPIAFVFDNDLQLLQELFVSGVQAFSVATGNGVVQASTGNGDAIAVRYHNDFDAQGLGVGTLVIFQLFMNGVQSLPLPSNQTSTQSVQAVAFSEGNLVYAEAIRDVSSLFVQVSRILSGNRLEITKIPLEGPAIDALDIKMSSGGDRVVLAYKTLVCNGVTILDLTLNGWVRRQDLVETDADL
jgi:hypothetical protein